MRWMVWPGNWPNAGKCLMDCHERFRKACLNHFLQVWQQKNPNFSNADKMIGAGVPCYVVEDDGALTAETADAPAAPAAVVAASDAGALEAALAAPSTAAVALPPDANLWAFALTGMRVLASEDDGETS